MPLTVQQALHGYSDGHRLVASSIDLMSSENRTMQVMSDLSGNGVRPPVGGYLTGYPLDGVGRYVLARTWGAPEMPRPGCVWTHSLIIDNADLAALASASGLLAAFRRPPDTSSRSFYTAEVQVPDLPPPPTPAATERARSILNAVYSSPGQSILAEAKDADEDERIALAIWMQQWPRLRRSFGFCTLSGMDRSGKGAALDLQMAPTADRQLRSRFPSAVVPTEAAPEPALGALADDLLGLDASGIREFLRRAGGDVDGGRRAMTPLCRLHASLFSGPAPSLAGAVTALAELDRLSARSAGTVRALVVRRAIEEIGTIDDEVFDFMLDFMERSPPSELPVLTADFVRALWRRSPQRFKAAISNDGPIGIRCREALTDMPLTDLMSGLALSPTLVGLAVAMRPEVLERAELWSIPDVDVDVEVARALSRDNAPLIAWSLASAGRSAAAPKVVDTAEPGDLVRALEAVDPGQEAAVTNWLLTIARAPERLAETLASGSIGRMSTIVILARASDPDTVPNDYGEDPWIIALRGASGLVREVDHDFLAAFAVCRALGWTSRSTADLLRFGYGRLYRALQETRLPEDVELMAVRRLDRSWAYWDYCARLRSTVARVFLDNWLDPETFGRITDDGALVRSLIDETAQTRKGRRYLEDVRLKIRHASEKPIRERASYILRRI